MLKIIDILVKKANEELEDGFKFKYNGNTYIYDKEGDDIVHIKTMRLIGDKYVLEKCLNDTVEVIEEQKEIEEMPNRVLNTEDLTGHLIEQHNKINELVRAVNKMNKKREAK